MGTKSKKAFTTIRRISRNKYEVETNNGWKEIVSQIDLMVVMGAIWGVTLTDGLKDGEICSITYTKERIQDGNN